MRLLTVVPVDLVMLVDLVLVVMLCLVAVEEVLVVEDLLVMHLALAKLFEQPVLVASVRVNLIRC
jgi:hypothetical protein